MATNFPYFKFIATEWLTGDIVYESFEVQGLFINICAVYWNRNGLLSLEEIDRRFKNPELFSKLTDRFISVNGGVISISFLDEQLIQAGHVSKVNSQNGKKGGRPKTLENKPNGLRNESELKPIRIKEEEKKNKNKRKEEVNIPTEFDFLDFCKSFLNGKYEPLEFSLKAKFESWVLNGWKDGNGKNILNWKSKIKNTVPYLKPMAEAKYTPVESGLKAYDLALQRKKDRNDTTN